MPFREKIAWIAVTSIAAAFIAYFGLLASAAARGHVDHGDFIGWLILIVIGQIAVTIVATAIIAIRSPSDAHAPKDERDRQISARTAAVAYPLLLAGVICAAATVHLGLGLFGMLNAILATIMLAEALRFALQVVAYRRGR